MINGKRLLYGLLASQLLGRRAHRYGRGFGHSGLSRRGGTLGLLAPLAIAAARHFMQRRGSAAGGGAAAGGGGLAALFGGADPGQQQEAAGALPEVAVDTPPSEAENEEALALIRAMVAAARADGVVDPEERQRVIDNLNEAGATEEERRFIVAELDRPQELDAIVAAGARSPQMAEEIYAASLLAIEIDTDAERAHLRNLAARLGLDAATVAELHDRFDAPRPD
jgi:uncharacterized membrane protein YebE (DUF533 family)